MPSTFRPTLGAWLEGEGVHFRLWAPQDSQVELVLASGLRRPMERQGNFWEVVLPEGRPGLRYRYQGRSLWPDPASRFQPEGVQGPSEVVDLRYPWTDEGWPGLDGQELSLYELHVGTFTQEGTFRALQMRLPYLKSLGVSAIELMPVSEFPGRWGWGYDPAALFAPSRGYGRPQDLQALVNTAHALGLGVILDVVYNHFGPEGAYAVAWAPQLLSDQPTPWGRAMRFEDPQVRAFFLENALYWLSEYHLDGLRLDATHAYPPVYGEIFLKELVERVRELPGPRRILIAEDERNLDRLIRPEEIGLDGVWADDLHHALHRFLTQEDRGYYQDVQGTLQEVAQALNQGWLYTGQISPHLGRPRGTPTQGIPQHRFVICLQNHDQVGNRPHGDRLDLPPEVWRALHALLLLAPQTPLLFMGQEWGTQSPFHFFSDLSGELGEAVRRGRNEEFRAFGFSPADPQDPETFFQSKLRWSELLEPERAGLLRAVQDLLAWRKLIKGPGQAWSPTPSSLYLKRGDLTLVVSFSSQELPAPPGRVVWHSEEPDYTSKPQPPELGVSIRWQRAGALLVHA